MPVEEEGDYQVILSTDDYRFGGFGRIHHRTYTALPQPDGRVGFTVYLPSRTAMVLQKKPVRK